MKTKHDLNRTTAQYFDREKSKYKRSFPKDKAAAIIDEKNKTKLRNPVFAFVLYSFIAFCFILLFINGKPSYHSRQVEKLLVKYEVKNKLNEAFKKMEKYL